MVDCPYIVYLDLDNTLVEFSTKENEKEQLEKMYQKGFYKSLKPAPHAVELVKALKEVKVPVKIITGLIDSPYCEEEKIEYCEEVFGISREDVITLPREESKASVAVSLFGNLTKKHILIDDYIRYVEEWDRDGGLAIHCSRKNVGWK